MNKLLLWNILIYFERLDDEKIRKNDTSAAFIFHSITPSHARSKYRKLGRSCGLDDCGIGFEALYDEIT
jgi:hypothetical protein